MTDVTVLPTNKPPLVVLRERLEQRRNEIKHALPSDVSVDAFIRAAITSAQLNPEIQACSWSSVWTSCLRACRDGLLPDGVEGAIVPFKSTATWIPMYIGLLRRFRRSGQFKWVTAGLVREGEEFSHWIDETGEHFRHVPGDDITKPILRIYCLATTLDGGVFCAVLPIAEANKIKAMSRATREDSPWRQWPEEMYKKTAIRRLSKVLPSARDIIGEDDIPEVPLGLVPSEPAPLPADPPMTTPAGDVPEGGAQGEGSYPKTPAADPAPKGFKPAPGQE
jgi:recombination protein RecT